jgi:hypothetical protein
MATGTRYPVVLSANLRSLLEKLAGSRTTTVRRRRNARILLLRADRTGYQAIVDTVGCSRDAVARVCRLFAEGGWKAVCQEAPRGQPWSHDEPDREDVLAWAQTHPQALGLPITRWSLHWLQVLWRQRKASPAPARETLRRWLRAAKICWFSIRSFCRSTDPHWKTKATAVCDAYLHAPADWAVLSYDQKPHLQALSRDWPTRYAIPDHPGQRPHEYHRHGTTCLHAVLDVRSGAFQFSFRDDHKGPTIAALLADWVRAVPEQKVIVVLDNVAANHCPPVQAALTATGKLVLMLPIPTHSSWLNQVERVFADLQRELLDHCQALNLASLETQLRAWADLRNTLAKPYHWNYHPSLV